jgi:hypothetical protein
MLFVSRTALDFREYIGGEEKINAYCRKLAKDGGKRLAEILDTNVMEWVSTETGEDELTLSMVRSLALVHLFFSGREQDLYKR